MIGRSFCKRIALTNSLRNIQIWVKAIKVCGGIRQSARKPGKLGIGVEIWTRLAQDQNLGTKCTSFLRPLYFKNHYDLLLIIGIIFNY